jgi:hypothetical protein
LRRRSGERRSRPSASIWFRRYGGRVFLALAVAALALWPLDVGVSVGLLFAVVLAAGVAHVEGWALLSVPAVVVLAALDDAVVDGLILAAALGAAYLFGRLSRWGLDRATGRRLD